MPEKFESVTPPQEGIEKQGFNEVHHLTKGDKYEGNADVVLLVWHDNQVLPAEQYRKANYPDKVVDVAVCQNPNVQKEQLGDKAIIYDFGSSQSSGGGVNAKEDK
ncbi:MAG: hypothetical protein V1668_04670 [Patescibacteria group bacterium]